MSSLLIFTLMEIVVWFLSQMVGIDPLAVGVFAKGGVFNLQRALFEDGLMEFAEEFNAFEVRIGLEGDDGRGFVIKQSALNLHQQGTRPIIHGITLETL